MNLMIKIVMVFICFQVMELYLCLIIVIKLTFQRVNYQKMNFIGRMVT